MDAARRRRQRRAQADGARPRRTGRRSRASGWTRSRPQPRQVFFFDTPDLALERAGRRRAGAADPGRPRRHRHQAAAGRARRAAGGDAHAPRASRSRSTSCQAASSVRVRSRAGAAGRRSATPSPATLPLRKLFSKEQRAFYTTHAPEGIELDSLVPLGPTFILKARVHTARARPPIRGRDVALPGRVAHPGAVDEVPAPRGVPGRRGSTRLPGQPRRRRSAARSRPRRRPPWRTSRPSWTLKRRPRPSRDGPTTASQTVGWRSSREVISCTREPCPVRPPERE